MAMFLSRIKQVLNLGTKSITSNGTYNASSDGYDGYSSVDVAIPTPTSITPSNASPAALTSGSAVTPSANGYAIESYSSITPTSIDGPEAMTADSIYKPTVNSYAIDSYTTVVSSDSTPPNLTVGNMYRVPSQGGAGGYFYKTQASSITPSNASPVALTSGTKVNPSTNGYAIESYTEVVPSNASPATLSNGSIYKIKTNGGKAVASITDVTPSSTPTSVSANDVVKIGGSGVIVDSVPPTPTSITPSNSSPVGLSANTPVNPTASGYAISSYSSITPSNSSPATITSGSIYKASASGKAVASVTDITPTTIDGPVSMSANTVYRPTAGSYAINSYTPVASSDTNPPNLTQGNMYRISTSAGASGYLYKSSGLGKCKAGTFTSSTSSQTINLGFQPKYLLVMTEGRTSNIFDYSYSSTKAVYATTSSGNTEYTIGGNTSNNHIGAISSTGFTYNKSGSAGSTIYYFAVG